MTLRSLIALMLLANYMLLAVMGGISRQQDNAYILMIKSASSESQHYEQCRYLRMDGIEDFMAESLASKYNEDTNAHNSDIYYMVSGIDVHHLPTSVPFSITSLPQKEPVLRNGEPGIVRSIALAIFSPPEVA